MKNFHCHKDVIVANIELLDRASDRKRINTTHLLRVIYLDDALFMNSAVS